ncbi:MAG: TIGR01906 family membrane protein [Defluviitaleaceae bacterium]|nr:TIGR01906 family membrane protein [Defluviitaleaceae bacterium]
MKDKAKALWTAIGIASAVCLIILILRFAVFIPSMGMWFYQWQYNVNDTYAVVDMEPEHLHEVTRHMIRYMQGREPDLQIMTVIGGQPRYFFSDIEIRHMIDVYDLFAIGSVIFIAACIVFVATAAAFAIWGRGQLKYLLKSWQITSAAVFCTLLALVAIIAINWHHAFVIFHEIFFDNDYWILDHRVDLLVNIVPYPFFITISIVIGGFFAAGLVIVFAAASIVLRRFRPFLH